MKYCTKTPNNTDSTKQNTKIALKYTTSYNRQKNIFKNSGRFEITPCILSDHNSVKLKFTTKKEHKLSGIKHECDK